MRFKKLILCGLLSATVLASGVAHAQQTSTEKPAAATVNPDQVDFMQFLPVSPTETLIREIAYALPDERREMKAARYLNWRINRRVNAEDTVLVKRVQEGMASPNFIAGPLSREEVCLRAFGARMRALIPEARLPAPPAPGWSRG